MRCCCTRIQRDQELRVDRKLMVAMAQARALLQGWREGWRMAGRGRSWLLREGWGGGSSGNSSEKARVGGIGTSQGQGFAAGTRRGEEAACA